MAGRIGAVLVWVLAGSLMLAGCAPVGPVDATRPAEVPESGAPSTGKTTAEAPSVDAPEAVGESPSPVSTAPPMTIDEAAAYYLGLNEQVRTLGPAQADIDAAVASGDWKVAQQLMYGPLPAVYRELGDLLRSAAWPAEVQDAIDALIEYNDARIARVDAIVAATTEDEFQGLLDAGDAEYAAQVAAGTADAETNAVRAILGLPPKGE